MSRKGLENFNVSSVKLGTPRSLKRCNHSRATDSFRHEVPAEAQGFKRDRRERTRQDDVI